MSRDKSKIKMKRLNICITKLEYEQINKNAEETGLSVSDILRRIIDEFYKKKE